MHSRFCRPSSRTFQKSEMVKVSPMSPFPYMPYLWRIVESTMYWVKQIFNLLRVQGKSDFRLTYGLQPRTGDEASNWSWGQLICCGMFWQRPTHFSRWYREAEPCCLEIRALWTSKIQNWMNFFPLALNYHAFRSDLMMDWYVVLHPLLQAWHMICDQLLNPFTFLVKTIPHLGVGVFMWF